MSYLDKANVSGTVYDLVKPLYFHGLDIWHSVKKNGITVTVINTDGTPISGLAAFKSWAESISGAVTMPCNGTIYINGAYRHTYMIKKNADNTWGVWYNDDSTGYENVTIVLDDEFDNVTDNYNKIN